MWHLGCTDEVSSISEFLYFLTYFDNSYDIFRVISFVAMTDSIPEGRNRVRLHIFSNPIPLVLNVVNIWYVDTTKVLHLSMTYLGAIAPFQELAQLCLCVASIG